MPGDVAFHELRSGGRGLDVAFHELRSGGRGLHVALGEPLFVLYHLISFA